MNKSMNEAKGLRSYPHEEDRYVRLCRIPDVKEARDSEGHPNFEVENLQWVQKSIVVVLGWIFCEGDEGFLDLLTLYMRGVSKKAKSIL